jgi:predicted CoA-binding protein
MSESNTPTKKVAIQHILKTSRTIAVVGLSSRPERAGYYVPAYLQKFGYRIIPVNPYLTEALGEKAYPDLLALTEPVDLVLIFQRSGAVPPFVDQAIQIGAKAIWMQLGISNQPAAEKARQSGVEVVMDACMLVEHQRWGGLAPAAPAGKA